MRPTEERRIAGVDPLSATVALVAMLLFCILTALVVEGRTMVLDHQLIATLRAGATPVITTVMLAVTFVSGRLAIPAAALFAFLLFRRDGWRNAWYYVAACATAQLLNLLLKYGIGRARPHGISPKLTAAGGPSYPSADVMMSVVVFGLGVWVLSRSIESDGQRAAVRLSVAIYVIASAIARVYLGAHWPSDVLGALIAGVTCSAFWTASALSDVRTLALTPLLEGGEPVVSPSVR
ncbi:MAG TPA: phosphatase PAP2 family protein [Gemmatimonadaceae bacterium]|nr:phosphatase PAP2 family protein [Gemmatimonadaceae bacterium]